MLLTLKRRHRKTEQNVDLAVRYPDFRFSCPKCGSIDVFLFLRKKESPRGHCLECSQDW